MTICPNCSAADLPDKANVCGHCGTGFTPSMPSPIPQANAVSALRDKAGARIERATPPPPGAGHAAIRPRWLVPIVSVAGVLWSLGLDWATVTDEHGTEMAIDAVSVKLTGLVGNTIGPDATSMPVRIVLLVAVLGIIASTALGSRPASRSIGALIAAVVLVLGAQLAAGVPFRWSAADKTGSANLGAWIALTSGRLLAFDRGRT